MLLMTELKKLKIINFSVFIRILYLDKTLDAAALGVFLFFS